MKHRPPPQTDAQRQAALRARREALGLTEVRNIYLPPALHDELRILARMLSEDGACARKGTTT